MGFKLNVNVITHNELFVEVGGVSITVMMRGRDEPLLQGSTNDQGWFFDTIDLSGDALDEPRQVYFYASKDGYSLCAVTTYSDGQPYYAGQDQVKTWPFHGEAILVGGGPIVASPPPP